MRNVDDNLMRVQNADQYANHKKSHNAWNLNTSGLCRPENSVEGIRHELK